METRVPEPLDSVHKPPDSVHKPLGGRRALVTGAATGIGRATAIKLASDGAAVVVNYVGNSHDADTLVADIEGSGGRALALEADVSQEDEVGAMFDAAGRELSGPIDLLVNNAGIEKPFALVDMPLAEWNQVLAVNLTGAFLCARATARALIAADSTGVIVNVSSVHEQIPWPSFGHYCASKGGLKLWSQTVARELAPRGIRVVNVAPGAILTPINKDLIEHSDKRREVEEEVPLGRLGKPEEIAAAIAWLASNDASYVTGTTLFVDGGMTTYPRFI